MKDVHTIELFCLKGSVMFQELRELTGMPDDQDARTDIERYTDALVDRHLAQIDPSIRSDAQRMGEFFRMFYSLENDMRDLISYTMDEQFDVGWWGDRVPEAVRKNVKSNKGREEGEGIPPRSNRKIDYTTFGELGEIIKMNWDVFRGIFSNASLDRVVRVINRLNLARGPIANSGIVPPEESVRLKLAIRDWYSLME